MATYDSSDLLSRFNRLAKRPSSDEITDAVKYALLAQAQMDVIYEIAIRAPYALYQDPAALSTSDNKEFTFGTDGNGHAVTPYGYVGIYPSLNAIPDMPWVKGLDYLDEGTLIRIPNNRTYGGTLYWRGIATPADIASGTQPALRPAPARVLIVIKAVWNFALEGGARPALADAMERMWAQQFPVHMAGWKTRFRGGGALDTRLIRTDPWGGATAALGR
jgi:hypothetical protein